MGRTELTPEQHEEGRRLVAALRAARAQRNEPQARLATRSGVSLDTIRALEGNRITAPSFFVVARLARELDVTLDALAGEALQDR